jgi:hypothetical protein
MRPETGLLKLGDLALNKFLGRSVDRITPAKASCHVQEIGGLDAVQRKLDLLWAFLSWSTGPSLRLSHVGFPELKRGVLIQ